MTNLLDLPNEILDLIFYHCSDDVSYSISDTNVFIRYEYINNESNSIRRYYEYSGEMKNGKPHGCGEMYMGTKYYTSHFIPKYIFLTKWLYLPLFQIFSLAYMRQCH